MEHFTPSEAPIHETARLPVKPPAGIVGRNQTLGQTFATVREGAAVLLHGPSGVGKSVVAATVASAFTSPALPGGVLWWPVERDSLEQLVVRLGRAYGERALTDSPRPLDQLDLARDLLAREHKPLLVLDGIPDLDAVRAFREQIAPDVPMILTAEQGAPDPWTPIPIMPLSDNEAVTLFMQTAGYDQVSSVIRADIQGICSALRGLPLAITLAGRWVRVTGQKPGEFLGTLTAPGHSGPLLGLYSIFQSLPDALQGLLLSLGATFAGRASLALLERLNPTPAETATHVMGMLVARGLVHAVPGQGTLLAYDLHEMVHSFTQSWLQTTGRLEAATAHVCETVVAYAEQYSANTREAHEHLIVELPNILRAARYAVRREDGPTLARLQAALIGAFGEVGGYGYEISLLSRMTTRLATLGKEPELTELPPPPAMLSAAAPELAVQPSAPPAMPEAPPLAPPDELQAEEDEAAALCALGQSLLEEQRLDDAQGAFSKALALYEASQDAMGMLDALEGLAEISLYNNDLENAVLYATRAVNFAAQSDDPARYGHTLMLLGDVRVSMQELDQAVEAYAGAVEMFEASDDALGLGVARSRLGQAHMDRGDFVTAIDMLAEARVIFEQMERADYQMSVLNDLGVAYRRLGQLDEAELQHLEALDLARALDNPDEQQHQLEALAAVAGQRGSRATQIARLRQALDLAYQTDDLNGQVRHLDALGRLLMDDVTQVATAVMFLEEAETIAPDAGRARLLNRAQTRLERVQQTGTRQAPPPDDIAQWAADASLELETDD